MTRLIRYKKVKRFCRDYAEGKISHYQCWVRCVDFAITKYHEADKRLTAPMSNFGKLNERGLLF